MWKSIYFAGIAALGNALFVYGQKRTSISNNPFIFTTGAVIVCAMLFVVAVLFFRDQGDLNYLTKNISSVIISGIGFFLTFLGFFLLYSMYGAPHYAVYAVISILTTSIGVGVLIYKETFNTYQLAAVLFAILSVALFSYGQVQGQ